MSERYELPMGGYAKTYSATDAIMGGSEGFTPDASASPPTTPGLYALLGAHGVSAIVNTVGAFSQARAMREQASHRYRMSEINYQISEMQAQRTMEIGHARSQKIHQYSKQLVGQQRASYASQGVKVGAGTAVDIQVETEMMAAADADQVRMNAILEAWGHRFQGASAMSQAHLQRQGAEYAAQSQEYASLPRLVGNVAQGMYYYEQYG
jgi:hypothetical protein